MFRRLLLLGLFFSVIDGFLGAITKSNRHISVLNADSFETRGDIAYLKGNVHLKEKTMEIRADEIQYDKAKGTIIAKGDVYLTDAKGNIYYSNEMNLADSLKKGNIKNIQIRLHDKSRIAAKESIIDLSHISKAKKVKFSSCASCKENPKKPLVWELSSDEITYNHESEDIYYKNAVFRFLGVPVFYFPTFTHPSPKVERRSGVLFPKFIFSQKLGFIAINSYLFALSKSSEFIARMALSTKFDRLFFGEYNKVFTNADIHIGFSITDNVKLNKYLDRTLSKDEQEEADRIEKRGFRGHIDANLNFWNKQRNTRVFSKIKLLSDKSYFNRYTFIPNQGEDDLHFEKSFYETNVGLERFDRQQYVLLKMITFQNTLTNDADFYTPYIAPYCELDLTKPLDNFRFGGYLNTYVSFMNCDFQGGDKDRKLFGKVSYLKNHIASNGMVFDLKLSVLLHLLNIQDKKRGFNNTQITNASPKITARASYPLKVHYTNQHYGILTPEAKFVSSVITNKDFEDYLKSSSEFVDYFELNKANMLYDDVNMDINSCFIENRFVTGIGYEHFLPKRRLANIFIGQMFFLEKPKYTPNTGISNDNSSDIIVNGDIFLTPNLSLNYNAMIASSFKSSPRRSVSMNYANDRFWLNMGLANGMMYNLNSNKRKYDTFFINTRYVLSKHYDFFAGKQFGDRNTKSLSHYIGLRYQDECFTCELKMERVFYRKVDCNNDTRIILTFNLKNLGEFKINQKIRSQRDDRRPYGYY